MSESDPTRTGLFNPPAVALPRRTDPTSDEALAELERAAAHELLTAAAGLCSERIGLAPLVYPFS